jgi:hypothetical protein
VFEEKDAVVIAVVEEEDLDVGGGERRGRWMTRTESEVDGSGVRVIPHGDRNSLWH